ncbi:HEAT repeat domain-containing protein [Glycomyces albidus]|uniref:HEAT repeat domain-containing protein n=1 Tax=Glycomyces albidus TaxID=2656774 RepID=A0A6L5GCZ4_9ACTN|nr:HEAT repeat domain-containing protein [Glycomyces albidus]MQM27562.1 HEAT repeat domain-containing protein [Glycomyces albidus]
MNRVFRDAMRLMRDHDPQRQEDGFHALLPVASEYIDELLEEFQAEHDDHGLRCWLLELIGEARSSKGLPTLADQLNSSDEVLRGWAEHGLRLLDSKEARRILWEAEQGSPRREGLSRSVSGRVGRS